MYWVLAILRDKKVYARATATGALAAENGRVEIRYKPHDGKRYDARADNLVVSDPTPLPDATCGPAMPVAQADKPSASAIQSSAVPGPKGRIGMSSKVMALKNGVPAVPEGAIIVYADGACSGNPGPAGLGVVVIDGPKRVELSEYLGDQTNNIAELTAVLRALGDIATDRPAVIHTDSQYTINMLSKGWKAKANAALIADLRSKLRGYPRVTFVYVPGHAGVLLNERADALAREAVQTRKTKREVFTSKSLPPSAADAPAPKGP